MKKAQGWQSLTPAERRVVDLVSEGLTNPEIGKRLFVSRYTVQTHLRRVFRKLNVATRAELAAKAVIQQSSDEALSSGGEGRSANTFDEQSGGRIVHRGPGFELGLFACPHDNARWNEENSIGHLHHIVFPGTSVLIYQKGEEIVADPNIAVLYDPNQAYRRALIDPRGDYCSFAIISPELFAEMTGQSSSGGSLRWPTTTVVVNALTYVWQWSTVRTFLNRSPQDQLALDEQIVFLLGGVARSAFSDVATPRERGGSRIVEKTRRVLCEKLGEQLRLDDVAAEVHVSPHHLTRLFRRETGLTLHRYLTNLRLRCSLDRLASGDEPLAKIASSLGFASHSHFTERFRSVFGFPPTVLRKNRAPVMELCRLIQSDKEAFKAGLSS